PSSNFVRINYLGSVVAQTDLNTLGINMKSGLAHTVNITSGGTTIQVSIDSIFVASATALNLASISPATVGFGAHTGAFTERHDILSWSFACGTCSSPNRRILIAHADGATAPNTLRNQLLALPGVATVDIFNAGSGTPTLAQLQQYDAVVVFSNFSFLDPIALGNNLASYEDGGGVVVAFNFAWGTGNAAIQGRWLSGGYSPYNSPGTNNFANGTLGTYTVGHPLMQGVAALNAVYRMSMTLTSGATQVAAWNDGPSLIAYKGRAIGVSAYVGDAAGNWSGDFGKVVVNATNWL